MRASQIPASCFKNIVSNPLIANLFYNFPVTVIYTHTCTYQISKAHDHQHGFQNAAYRISENFSGFHSIANLFPKIMALSISNSHMSIAIFHSKRESFHPRMFSGIYGSSNKLGITCMSYITFIIV